MGQVYLNDYEGPLYAYVEFKVADLTVTSANGYAQFDNVEKYSLDHITDFEHGDAYISNVVMSFSYTKESSVNRGGKSWGIGQEFNITVFDDSAIYVEDIIANALSNTTMGANCYIEYGWSSNGKKIDERCCGFEGLIREYTLSFDGPSTTLSIVGTTTQVVSLGTTYVQGDGAASGSTISLDADITMSGNPAEIVLWGIIPLLNENSDGITYVADESTVVMTQTIYVDTDKEVPKNFPCVNKSLYSYIIDDLAPEAVSNDGGKCGYVFYMLNDPENDKIVRVYFKPQESLDNTYNIANENDDLNGNGLGDTFENNINSSEGEIVRTYNYYGDFQNNEVMSFSTDFKGIAVQAGAKFTSAIDANTNELIACEVVDSGNTEGVSASSACRVMGLSSGTSQALDTAMRDLWNKYATQVYTASLEILGDPNINTMEHIYINVYTKYNQKHHTSGEYLVQSVEDSVDSGGFTTSLLLVRKGGISDIDTSVLSESTFSYDSDVSDIDTSGNLRDRGFSSSVDGSSGRKDPIINSFNERGYPKSYDTSSPVTNSDGSLSKSQEKNRPTAISSEGGGVSSTKSPNSPTSSYTLTILDDSSSKSGSAVANPVIYNGK